MDPLPGKIFIDATGGPGNMSAALLGASSPDVRVLTLDRDPRAIAQEEAMLGIYGDRGRRRRANFSEIAEAAKEEGFTKVHGILFDLGLSSGMLDCPEYGAAIMHDSRPDMRMDPNLRISAYELINSLSEDELIEMFRGMDEQRWARRIAKAIVLARNEKPIESTVRLAEIVASAIPKKFHPRHIHPATRVFLALRVAVNHERESLKKALEGCPELLIDGGVLVVICYSSFEDRIVREFVRERRDSFKRLTKKAVTPDEEEIRKNPRSRSARLRAYRKAS